MALKTDGGFEGRRIFSGSNGDVLKYHFEVQYSYYSVIVLVEESTLLTT